MTVFDLLTSYYITHTFMKRSHTIIFAIALSLALWLWLYPYLTLQLWISLPLTVLASLALYALIDILTSIGRMKGYPLEKRGL